MPVPLVATLDIDDFDQPVTTYQAFINAILAHVADEQGRINTTGDYSQPGRTRVFRLRRDHRDDVPDSIFRVRIRHGTQDLVDFFIQDSTLYGWGFSLPDQLDLYHLSNPPAGLAALASRNYRLHDTQIPEHYDRGGLPHGALGWGTLFTALDQLRENVQAQAAQRAALGLLVEMVCEATRFRGIATILGTLWGTGSGVTTDDQRRQITDLEANWDSISTLFLQYGPMTGELPNTPLSHSYPTIIAVALALTVLHARPADAPSTSRSGSGAVRPVVASDTDPVPAPTRQYPVLDAGGNQPGTTGKAWFFRPGTCMTYDLTRDSVVSGDPRPFSEIWPGLKDTDFGLRVDAVVPSSGSSAAVWLFSGHQYARYDTKDHTCSVHEIADKWPALADTSFIHYIDAAVHDPREPGRYLFLFRDSDVLTYDLRTDTIEGPFPIAETLPSLARTSFAYGVSAAVAVPGSNQEVWLFRGDDCVRYNLANNSLTAGPQRIHEGFTDMRGKAFADGVSAVLPCSWDPTPDLWLFHDDLYLRYSLQSNRITVKAAPVASTWTQLGYGCGFADRIDAALLKPRKFGERFSAWFFQGDRYLSYNVADDKVANGPSLIADGWTGLQGTGFEHGINAILSDPGDSNAVWIFAGDQYVRYYLNEDRLVGGPTPIGRSWKGLRDTVFSRHIDAACPAPTSSGEAWLFSGDVYVRYHLGRDRITSGPARINDSWHLDYPHV
ncbi:ribosome-inactivating family protein [Streptomyces spectabilis]|uniref:ribosome-inactivating family protein n=1 Tax=Streptomyces spectabilis TaxID=68270 RepID=UPI001376D882|nr:ribosome-inactivating family protein [Streptomyces spectabilis]